MRLPLPLLLALRYARSARRDAYVSLLSTLAGGGIALGVGALIVVLAGLAGLQSFLRDDVLARTPHLELELPVAEPGAAADPVNSEPLLDDLRAFEGVEEARLLLRGRGWMLIGGRPVDVRIVGYSGELPEFFPQTEEQAATSLRDGIFTDAQLARRWGLELGHRLQLVSPRPTLTPLGPQPRTVNLRFAGSFEPGRTEVDQRRVAVPLEVAARLLGERRQRIELRAASLEEALVLADRLRSSELLPAGARLHTWKELNRGLFFALQLEKRLMFVSVFLIVPVAAMALITVLALLVSAKRSEIGMLHALGASPRDVFRTFLALGTLLSLVGLVAGGALGVGGALALDHFRLIAPPGDVYFIDHVPFRLLLADLLRVLVSTLAFTFGSTVLAARRAASLDPLEALSRV